MRLVLALALLMASQIARGEETLCTGEEKVVFSCHVGARIVSLCRPPAHERQLTYRFGRRSRLELVYPARTEAKGGFYTWTAPLYGGGETIVAFERSGYSYRVYSRVGRSGGGTAQERIPEFEDGLVVARAGKEVRRLVCDDGGEVFREDIGWLPKRAPH